MAAGTPDAPRERTSCALSGHDFRELRRVDPVVETSHQKFFDDFFRPPLR
jgi:hypothetical protein